MVSWVAELDDGTKLRATITENTVEKIGELALIVDARPHLEARKLEIFAISEGKSSKVISCVIEETTTHAEFGSKYTIDPSHAIRYYEVRYGDRVIALPTTNHIDLSNSTPPVSNFVGNKFRIPFSKSRPRNLMIILGLSLIIAQLSLMGGNNFLAGVFMVLSLLSLIYLGLLALARQDTAGSQNVLLVRSES